MTRLLVRRLGLGIVTLWVVSVIVFASTELLPGDAAQAILGQFATPEAIQTIRSSLELDRPAVVRYAAWLYRALSGDLGKSFVSRQAIGPIVAERLKNTFFLASVTACIAVPLALALGIIAAIHRDRWLDRVISSVTLVCVSVPEFFLAYLLMILLSRVVNLFPSIAQAPPDAGFLLRLEAAALPVITMVLVIVAYMMRMTRTAIIEVLSTTYIEMAHLKGTPNWLVVLRHALPNVISPIANVTAISLAYLVVGVIVVEVVFVYPGVGQLMVDAVAVRDVPMVQACGLVFGITYVCLNIAADLISLLGNPRLRVPR